MPEPPRSLRHSGEGGDDVFGQQFEGLTLSPVVGEEDEQRDAPSLVVPRRSSLNMDHAATRLAS